MVGIHEKTKLIIKYVDLEISKVGGSCSNNYLQNLWKFREFVEEDLVIENINFGRIESEKFIYPDADKKESQEKFYLFITNGEIILEYEIEIDRKVIPKI